MLEPNDWIQYFVGFVLLITIKLIALHFALKLAKWWKRDSKPTVKKCHDIYEYNFLDEYESEPEPQSDQSEFSTSDPVLDKSNVPQGAHSSRLQTAAKNLLASIRNRRERTAAALLNASMLSSTESTSGNHNESEGSPSFTFQNSKEFLQTSKYYAFLQEILESKNIHQRNE
jgi:hypothetical protein